MSNLSLIYQALDIKHTALVVKYCPPVVIDGVTWYDTTGCGLHDTRVYLQARGIIIIYPENCALWRIKE